MSDATVAAPEIVTPQVTNAEPAAPKDVGASIHDAVDALFATKEVTPAAVAPPTAEAAPTEAVEAPAEAPSVTPAPEAKLSASEYAVQLARAKKKLAKAQAAAAPAPKGPSPEAIKRAAAIEAAGGSQLAKFRALELDLAEVVKEQEKEWADNPEIADPLARKLKTLEDKLTQYESRERAAEETRAVNGFFAAVDVAVSKNDAYEYVAAKGQQGKELVKELVLEADKRGEVLMIRDALEIAEKHYSDEAATLLRTKKAARQFGPAQTRKPGIGAQAPAAAAAPTTAETKPKSVQDAIEERLTALGFT